MIEKYKKYLEDRINRIERQIKDIKLKIINTHSIHILEERIASIKMLESCRLCLVETLAYIKSLDKEHT